MTGRHRTESGGSDNGAAKPDSTLGLSPLLLTAKQAARLCAKSERTWRTWDAAGWIPCPVRIGRSVFWRLDELHQWTVAGCPRRAEWEATR
jgi:predicted DNA-binding transcriptional regulator AlpA